MNMTTMEYIVYRRLQKEGTISKVAKHEQVSLDSLRQKGFVVLTDAGWSIKENSNAKA